MAMAAEITVEWGYEIHRIVLRPKNWARVKSGQALGIRGKGYWYKGDFYWDYWSFGGGLDGALTVEYARPGKDSSDVGVGFDGRLSAAHIEEIEYTAAQRAPAAGLEVTTTWSDESLLFGKIIASCLEGPYDELLDAVRHLHGKIVSASESGRSGWLALENRLFGNPARFFQKVRGGGFRFGASLMDGPDVDVFEVAGLRSTDELHDGVWGETNWNTLLGNCPAVDVDEQYSLDEIPGQSDTYYWCEVTDPRQFARELRIALLTQAVATAAKAGNR